MGYSKVLEITQSQDSVDLSADDLDSLIIVHERPSTLKLSFPKLKGDNHVHAGNMISLINNGGQEIVTNIPNPTDPRNHLKLASDMRCRFILTKVTPKISWFIVGGV